MPTWILLKFLQKQIVTLLTNIYFFSFQKMYKTMFIVLVYHFEEPFNVLVTKWLNING